MSKHKSLSRKARIALVLVLFLVCLAGVAIATYPIWSEAYLSTVRAEVHYEYQQMAEKTDKQELDRYWESARAYNQKLANGEVDFLDPGASGYYEALSLPGTEVMAYVSIPKLNIQLPIFHGVGNEALDKGCGHMAQSSLPVGGESTHCAISAHTGMASSPMFSDLGLMEPGDLFQIEVLGEVLTYQVQSQEDIQVVLPADVTTIAIRPGEDICTLITCTPFGVNSHRLLVTGHRIETPAPEVVEQIQEQQLPQVQQQSVYRQNYIQALLFAGILLIVGLIAIFILRLWQSSRRKRNGN